MLTYSYGCTPEHLVKEQLQRLYPEEDYDIEVHEWGEDFKTLQDAVNIGIDSYLEAVSFTEFDGEYGRRGFAFDPDTLHVLLRRLDESGDENALNLRQSILWTLEIEEI